MKLVLIDFAWADSGADYGPGDPDDPCVRDDAGRSVEAAIRTADLDYMPEEDTTDVVERVEDALRRDGDLWPLINADGVPWEHGDYVLHARPEAYRSGAHAVILIPAEGEPTIRRGSLR